MSVSPAGVSRYLCWAVFCGCCLAGSALASRPAAAEPSSARRTAIVRAVETARPSVVNIRGEKTVGAESVAADPGKIGQRVNGMGTGVVIDPRGYVVTNFHVVDGVREIKVTLSDKRQCTARLVARDPETDLAIIKIDAVDRLPIIPIGTSSDLMTGEPVIAVGNAYGYEHTVTRGIISALHRAVQVSDAQFYDDLIQTDASINPGNSGGPLLNIDGQMIGVNVAVRAGAQGIGFAIPIDKVVAVVDSLLAARNTEATRHGLVLKPRGAEDRPGLIVAAVEEDSPAAEAGLKSGDVLTEVDDIEMALSFDFQRAMLDRGGGDRVMLRVRRGDESLSLDLTLAAARPKRPTASPDAWQSLGMELESIAPEQFRERYKTRYRGGLAVTSVRPESPAAEQGIHRGDVLVGMHIWETVSLENVSYILSRPDLAQNGPVKFYILRGNETLFGFLPLSMKDGKLTQR
ncbi:MAG: trypsin-like peptidase domain-containing protein [Pirellulales bacterium]|nr:trypsin-like peptidase domain-containing protein [Pirellulales bacterium]